MWRDLDGLADHGGGARARGGRSARRAEAGRAARRCAGARAARHRDGAARRSRSRARRCCGARRAPSARRRPWPARAASSPRPRSRSSRATSAGRAKALDAARATLEAHGDRVNAAHARHLEVRRLLLIGRLDEAERLLAALDPAPLTARVAGRPRAGRRRHRDAAPADRSGTRGARARRRTPRAMRGIPALMAEVESAARVLDAPAARLIARGEERSLLLEEVEALLASKALVVDACRHVVRDAGNVVSLATRPVLFALARALGRSLAGGCVARRAGRARLPRARRADESHRARLRVEIGRLRTMLRALADVSATKRGFALAPRRAREVVVLAPPVEEKHAAVLALLADGEVVVELGARARARREPAHACSARSTRWRGRQGAVVRPRARAPLDDAAGAGIHDDLVTPGSAAGRLGSRHATISSRDPMKQSAAEIVREYGPFPGVEQRARRHLRRPARLVRVRRQAERARSRERQDGARARRRRRMPARRSTASTCSRSPRTASRRSIRRPAACSPRSRRPATAAISGLAWAEGTLWVGQYRDRKIHQIDPETGAILRTHRIQPLRHRRDLGRRRALARHLGRRRERAAPHRSAQRRGAGAARHAGRHRRVRARVRRRRPLLLRRRTERQGARRAPAEAGLTRPASRFVWSRGGDALSPWAAPASC